MMGGDELYRHPVVALNIGGIRIKKRILTGIGVKSKDFSWNQNRNQESVKCWNWNRN